MTTTTMTSREFNQDASKAKQAAANGPVVITDRGQPSHVLLTFAEYKKLTAQRTRIADLLAMPGIEDIDLPMVRAADPARGVDLR